MAPASSRTDRLVHCSKMRRYYRSDSCWLATHCASDSLRRLGVNGVRAFVRQLCCEGDRGRADLTDQVFCPRPHVAGSVGPAEAGPHHPDSEIFESRSHVVSGFSRTVIRVRRAIRHHDRQQCVFH